MAFIKYIHEKSTTVEGMTCNRDEGSQQRCPLIARHAAGLLAFITIDLSVRVSRFAFVIAALGYIFMPTRSAKRRQQPSEKRAFITNRPRNRGITDGNPRDQCRKKSTAIVVGRLCSSWRLFAFCTRCMQRL